MSTPITTDRLALLDERATAAKAAFFAHVGPDPASRGVDVASIACATCRESWWHPGRPRQVLAHKDRLCRASAIAEPPKPSRRSRS